MLTQFLFLSSVVIGLCAPNVKNGAMMPNKHLGVKSNFSHKIILGKDANEGQFPYMLSLNYNSNATHRCGASVLTERWALTAAHCCAGFRRESLHIFSGTIYLSGQGQRYGTSQLLVHERFDPSNYWKNDICLIQIWDKFRYDDRIQQITLPTQGWPVEDGDLLTISGWGITYPFGLIIPDRLQVINNLVALSNGHCYELSQIQASDGYLCVLSNLKGQGICSGDSGGPLVKDGVQVGIASFTFLPCGSGAPDFYARVSNYIDWIKEKLGSDARDLKFVN